MLSNWRHSGSNAFCGNRISPDDETAMGNLARYIIRASFPQEWMTYLPEMSQVICQLKHGKDKKVFDALEWLAAMCSLVSDKGEQMVRYYGYYSNVLREKRQQISEDDSIPCIIEPEADARAHRKSWSRLIRKIYEVDPLT